MRRSPDEVRRLLDWVGLALVAAAFAGAMVLHYG